MPLDIQRSEAERVPSSSAYAASFVDALAAAVHHGMQNAPEGEPQPKLRGKAGTASASGSRPRELNLSSARGGPQPRQRSSSASPPRQQPHGPRHAPMGPAEGKSSKRRRMHDAMADPEPDQHHHHQQAQHQHQHQQQQFILRRSPSPSPSLPLSPNPPQAGPQEDASAWQARYLHMQQQYTRAMATVSRLRNEAAEAVQNHQRQYDDLIKEHEELRRLSEGVLSAYEQLQAQHEQCQGDMEVLQRQLGSAAAVSSALKSEVVAKQREVGALKEHVSTLELERQALRGQVQTSMAELELMAKTLKDAKGLHAQQQYELELAVQMQARTNQQLQQEVHELTAELHALKGIPTGTPFKAPAKKRAPSPSPTGAAGAGPSVSQETPTTKSGKERRVPGPAAAMAAAAAAAGVHGSSPSLRSSHSMSSSSNSGSQPAARWQQPPGPHRPHGGHEAAVGGGGASASTSISGSAGGARPSAAGGLHSPDMPGPTSRDASPSPFDPATPQGSTAYPGSFYTTVLQTSAAPPPSDLTPPQVLAYQEPLELVPTTSVRQLRMMLLEAGVGSERVRQCSEKSEMLELAAQKVNAWEVRRVLACTSLPRPHCHLAVFRMKVQQFSQAAKSDPEALRSQMARQKKDLLRKVHPDKHPESDQDRQAATMAAQVVSAAFQYLCEKLAAFSGQAQQQQQQQQSQARGSEDTGAGPGTSGAW